MEGRSVNRSTLTGRYMPFLSLSFGHLKGFVFFLCFFKAQEGCRGMPFFCHPKIVDMHIKQEGFVSSTSCNGRVENTVEYENMYICLCM